MLRVAAVAIGLSLALPLTFLVGWLLSLPGSAITLLAICLGLGVEEMTYSRLSKWREEGG